MPAIQSLSEFNRNQTAVIDELKATRAPLYLTKNGRASVVVMDAEAFDEAMSFQRDVAERERRVYARMLEGYEEYQRGEAMPTSEMFARLRADKGW